ncbi:Gfo/Idh/MocA family oxidoreductase [Starkeya koreensis]|uniref:Gfo/Idh/MocA family oxidoreductase n=1 Tax=Ancylobacter koreensis TaxID=266121 RepID=A0ABT0DRB6_9HYPH|nr:Gfo/Idh/MocA family oxidoreductase [Ancylobacter koreensis]MCK0209739.1 Gfo/Idh/MocA family oxidoreductase [Ancylobacter koreensis]
MRRIRLATIGTGFFGRYHYEAWNRIPEVELVGLAYARNRERAETFAAEYGVAATFGDAEAMMDALKPDLVDIISPPETHLPLVEAALRRGIPAITQKPLAPTLPDALRMVEIARAGPVPVVVHENWRFKPWFREIRRLIEGGSLGAVYNIAFRMRPGDGQGPAAYLDRQPYFQQMPRFLIHETGIHMIDVFRFLVGEITGVSARLRRLNPAIAGEDAGYVIFDFAGPTAGLLDGNRLADCGARNPRLTMGEFALDAEHGAVRLDGEGRIFVRRRGEEERQHPYEWHDRGYAGDAVYALQRHVIDHLTRGAPLENRVEDYIRNVMVEEEVYRSASERRHIAMDEIERRQAA